MCQDYMRSIVQDVDPKVLEKAGVKLVVIGCGDPGMIKSYNGQYSNPHLSPLQLTL